MLDILKIVTLAISLAYSLGNFGNLFHGHPVNAKRNFAWGVSTAIFIYLQWLM